MFNLRLLFAKPSSSVDNPPHVQSIDSPLPDLCAHNPFGVDINWSIHCANATCAPSHPPLSPSRSPSISIMPRRHRMRCRRGRGRGTGSRPPLSIHDERGTTPPTDNVAYFHFYNVLDKPRIITTISVVFQEVKPNSIGLGSRKRMRKSTISLEPPQDSRKFVALPVKSGTQSSSSAGNGSGSSEHTDRELRKGHNQAHSTSSHTAQQSKGDDDDSSKEYICLIVEEPPPTQNDS